MQPDAQKAEVQLRGKVVIGNQLNTAGTAMPVEFFVDGAGLAQTPRVANGTLQYMARDG